MNYQEAINKAAKLLRLSASSNPHEAALAASRAQEIIDRFKLSADEINGISGEAAVSEEPIASFGHDPLERATKVDRWKSSLAVSIAKANQCKVYLSGGICLIGRPSDVQTVRYVFAWLVREIERLASRDCKGTSRTYWNNFRLGAVEAVARKLKEQAAATVASVKQEALESGGSRALMVVENKAALMVQRAEEVEAWTKKHMRLRSAGSYRTNYNETARQAGRRAGASINLKPGSGRLGAGEQRRLGL